MKTMTVLSFAAAAVSIALGGIGCQDKDAPSAAPAATAADKTATPAPAKPPASAATKASGGGW